MRLVAVSVVKNEADIIEAFVRHTHAWVDLHLIFDHDSTDGTRRILQALRAEHLPIRLYTDDALGNLQQARSNELARRAASEFGADWILPLDADEILTGPGRPELEAALAQLDGTGPATLPMVNYYCTDADDETVANPVARLRYCQHPPYTTRKVMMSRALATHPTVQAGKGNHQLSRNDGTVLGGRALPPSFCLAHLALRSPAHQAMRVILAELQKLSRGRRHDGLDTHYRLGYQLLSENPSRFVDAARATASGLRHEPILYRGESLRHSGGVTGWERLATGLLPYLEKLAHSHGHLADTVGVPECRAPTEVELREVPVETGGTSGEVAMGSFAGFRAVRGLGPCEGPVPEAYLPRFHWGYAPETVVEVEFPGAAVARLEADVLTYCPQQHLAVWVGDTEIHRIEFDRVNQKERLTAAVPLAAGRARVSFRYRHALAAAHDPRKLATIFLSLRIFPA